MKSKPITCRRCGARPAASVHDLCRTCSLQAVDADFEATRNERAEGLLTLGRYLAAHAAFDDWCNRHPQDADVARTALNELRRLQEWARRAA